MDPPAFQKARMKSKCNFHNNVEIEYKKEIE